MARSYHLQQHLDLGVVMAIALCSWGLPSEVDLASCQKIKIQKPKTHHLDLDSAVLLFHHGGRW